MSQAPTDERYALLETVDSAGALHSAYAEDVIWRVCVAEPTPGSLTERERYEPQLHEDMTVAVRAFFGLMRDQGLKGVLDTPELRAWHDTPLDFACRLTEEMHDQADEIDEEDARDDDIDNVPLAPLREAMVDACPEFSGETPAP